MTRLSNWANQRSTANDSLTVLDNALRQTLSGRRLAAKTHSSWDFPTVAVCVCATDSVQKRLLIKINYRCLLSDRERERKRERGVSSRLERRLPNRPISVSWMHLFTRKIIWSRPIDSIVWNQKLWVQTELPVVCPFLFHNSRFGIGLSTHRRGRRLASSIYNSRF